ncbi:MAG: RNA polymerase-binding protein DksA [Thiotrichales bacterium]|jgi:DnaK suppressor protein|nr:RNA polymerase-binding protein DksA [Thiotrichales bacterium]
MSANQPKFLEDYPTYQVKPGEEYMSPEMLAHFRNKLTWWREQLLAEMNTTIHHLKEDSAMPADPNDRASQEEEFSLELRTRDRERKLIAKVEEALKRIDDGDFGYCTVTGEEIGLERLEARPTATMTVEAKAMQELREKQGIA